MNLLDKENIENSKVILLTHYGIKPNEFSINNIKNVIIKRVNCIDDYGREYVYTLTDYSHMVLQQCVKNYFDIKYDAILNTNAYKARPHRSVSNAVADMYRLVNLSNMRYCLKLTFTDIFKTKAFIKRKLYNLGVRDKFLFNMIDCLGNDIRNEYILQDTYDNIILSDFDYWLDSQWRINPKIYETKNYMTKSGSINYGNSYKKMRKTNLKEFYFVRYGREVCIFAKNFDILKRLSCAVDNYVHNHYDSELKFEKKSIIDLTVQSLYFDKFRFKIKSTNGHAFLYGYVQKDILSYIYFRLKYVFKNCTKTKNLKDVEQYIGIYNELVDKYAYECSIATNVSIDFHEIHNKMRIIMHNALCRSKYIAYKITGSIYYLTDKNIRVKDIGDVRYRKPKCVKKYNLMERRVQ